MNNDLASLLKTHFGYETFRPLQREIMEAALAGRDMLAILPTGAGKSLCYQLPALAREGLTLVVSPLIALMKDQVDQLTACGRCRHVPQLHARCRRKPAAASTASAPASTLCSTSRPERLMSGDFSRQPESVERHRRSPSTRRTASANGATISARNTASSPNSATLLPGVPVMALTATATDASASDIVTQLAAARARRLRRQLQPPEPHLPRRRRRTRRLRADRATSSAAAPARAASSIAPVAQAHRGARRRARRPTASRAVPYHAGLDADERARNQEPFSATRSASSAPPSPSAWASTSPTSASSSTTTCRRTSRATTRKPAAPAATACPPIACCSSPAATSRSRPRFIDEITDARGTRRIARPQLRQMVALRRKRRLPPRRSARLLRRDMAGRQLRRLRQLPRPARDLGRHHRRAEVPLLRLPRQTKRPARRVGIHHLSKSSPAPTPRKSSPRRHDQLSTYGIGKEHSAAQVGRDRPPTRPQGLDRHRQRHLPHRHHHRRWHGAAPRTPPRFPHPPHGRGQTRRPPAHRRHRVRHGAFRNPPRPPQTTRRCRRRPALRRLLRCRPAPHGPRLSDG